MRGKAIRQFHQFAAKTTRARSHVTVIVLEKFTQITCFDTREFFFNRKLFILFEVARVGVDLLGKSCMADWSGRLGVSRIFLLYRFALPNRVIYSRDAGVLFLIGPKLMCDISET